MGNGQDDSGKTGSIASNGLADGRKINWRVSAGDGLIVFIDNYNKIAVPCGGVTGIRYDEAAAMARLIAAAPALLEALELAVSYGWQHESALDAIASARGEV